MQIDILTVFLPYATLRAFFLFFLTRSAFIHPGLIRFGALADAFVVRYSLARFFCVAFVVVDDDDILSVL